LHQVFRPHLSVFLQLNIPCNSQEHGYCRRTKSRLTDLSICCKPSLLHTES
jgi:hypothetical protein